MGGRRSLTERADAAVRNGKSAPEAGERPWEEPVELPGLPPVDPFPLDVLPPALAAFVTDVADATNTPPDYPGSFALAIAAGVAGATRAVQIKTGHVQRASLYLCAVAPKGSGKSPALDAVADPVYDEQARRQKNGEDKKKKAFVSDVTAEKLAELLHDNPRGVLMIRDELAGWMLSFNQYKAGGKGSDRQFYLSAWSGSPVSVDRKNKDAEPVYVRFPCLTVVGTIQPSVLDRFKADADDGFYDRVLFCYPDERPLSGELWRTIDPVHSGQWADALGRLRLLDMDEGKNGPCPRFLQLGVAARNAWKGWTDSIADEVNKADFDESLRGPYVKLSGYAARLALVSRLLRNAYDETEPTLELDGEDMRRGVALGCYFLSHAGRAWAAAGLDARTGPARRLLRWIRERGTPFTRRDAHRSLQRAFPTSDKLTEPLSILVQHGYLRYAESTETKSGERSAPGRPAVTYELHPQLCQQRQRVNGVNASALNDCGPKPEPR